MVTIDDIDNGQNGQNGDNHQAPICQFTGENECVMSNDMIIYFKYIVQNLFKYLHDPSNWMKFKYSANFDKNILNNNNIDYGTKIDLILTNSNFIDDQMIDGFIEDGMINNDNNDDDDDDDDFDEKKDLYFTYFYNSCKNGIFDLVNFDFI